MPATSLVLLTDLVDRPLPAVTGVYSHVPSFSVHNCVMTRFFPSVWHVPQKLLIAIVKLYRLTLSAWIGGQCRFEPTCSVYAIGALEQRGAMVGSYLTVYRLIRCQPWCDGGHDPVPNKALNNTFKNTLFTRLIKPLSKQTPTVETKFL